MNYCEAIGTIWVVVIVLGLVSVIKQSIATSKSFKKREEAMDEALEIYKDMIEEMKKDRAA